MAIVVETLIPRASKDEADRFDDGINAAMGQRGGPPEGLRVHYTRPSGAGFLLCNIWRSEGDMRSFYDEVILPKLAEAGIAHEETTISPVWVLARP